MAAATHSPETPATTSPNPASTRRTSASRLARKAWQWLHTDSARAIASAEQAYARARERGDATALAWAQLTRAYHLLYFATFEEAQPALSEAHMHFEAIGDRAGLILSLTGQARGEWRRGRASQALERLLPLRDEGLQLLRNDDRGILLNTIAGCYSGLGQWEQAFAYLFQALRDVDTVRGHGFDAALYCNLAHELLQLGDYHEALRQVDEGLLRCDRLNNLRLRGALLINRIICLASLGRPAEAVPAIREVLNLPANESGRGTMGAHFESMAVAALRAGDLTLGRELVFRASGATRMGLADEDLELAVARAELALAQGELAPALAHLEAVMPLTQRPREQLGPRVHCLFFDMLARVHQQLGQPERALTHLRHWQGLHLERTHLASRARYQAAALQTELQRLRQALVETDARRRSTERARAELEAANEQLSQRVEEVQSLQTALRLQATQDFLTGLFNRRHLSHVLPSMLALAHREGQALSIALIDLDHFKEVNDRHGHAAGDQLLSAFGQLLARSGRKSDVPCRYGGEEFCLVMPRTDAHAAQRKLNALRRQWRQASFNFETGRVIEQTFSAGVADSLQGAPLMEVLLKAADDLLLRAKREGRNRVLNAGSPPHAIA
jgi:diguanylate cyclase (GGDEF)-like protein